MPANFTTQWTAYSATEYSTKSTANQSTIDYAVKTAFCSTDHSAFQAAFN
jgi:hypothetical protein